MLVLHELSKVELAELPSQLVVRRLLLQLVALALIEVRLLLFAVSLIDAKVALLYLGLVLALELACMVACAELLENVERLRLGHHELFAGLGHHQWILQDLVAR